MNIFLTEEEGNLVRYACEKQSEKHWEYAFIHKDSEFKDANLKLAKQYADISSRILGSGYAEIADKVKRGEHR